MVVWVPMSACIDLYTGENQVAYLGATTTVSQAISSISEYVTGVWWWDGTQWVELSGSDTMEYGVAYAIEVTQDCEWCVTPPDGGGDGGGIFPASMMTPVMMIMMMVLVVSMVRPDQGQR